MENVNQEGVEEFVAEKNSLERENETRQSEEEVNYPQFHDLFTFWSFKDGAGSTPTDTRDEGTHVLSLGTLACTLVPYNIEHFPAFGLHPISTTDPDKCPSLISRSWVKTAVIKRR